MEKFLNFLLKVLRLQNADYSKLKYLFEKL